jgi:glucuronoarabinoxylan endo-1,4-beta-xylanase
MRTAQGRRVRSAALLALLCVGVAASGSTSAVSTAATGPALAAAGASVRVDGERAFQRIDGFGFAEAFQRSNILHGSRGLSDENQQKVLDLLFDPARGAGFSILRNGIGSSPTNEADHMQSIAPVSPGSPDSTPTFVWDGSDNSQVWLSQQAAARGVRTIYADAWSAPGYMKTTGTDNNGGSLCGSPGVAACATGDWRQAYASVLAKYIQLYRQSGVRITHVGFVNEPELTVSYASMLATGAQAADFVKILDRTLRAQHLDTKIVCCDAEGWQHGADMVNDILQDPRAAGGLAVASSHGYTAAPTTPLTVARVPVWETEWADFNPWNPAWDDGSAAAGFTWAGRILTALTTANASAFLHWWGASASTANSGIVRLVGDSFELSGRYWALAAFSRFIRPGAVRISSLGDNTALRTAAFRNASGSVVMELLNSSTTAQDVDVSLRSLQHRTRAQVFLTGTGHDLEQQPSIGTDGGSLSTSVPARSLLTVVIPEHD